MNKQRKTSNILNVFQYDEATGIIGLNGVPVSGYALYLHTNINDGSVGIDSSASINALYLLKSGTKQFEISYDTSGSDKIFRLLPYQSGSFFQIGNPSNAGANYIFISEPTYGNVLIGPGIGNGTGNLTGATASIHKIQFNGAVFANSSIQATSFKITGGASTGFLKADGTVDTVTYLSGNQSITVTGDATGSGTTSIELTLANTAVTPGVYGSSTLVPVVTVDSKGRITNVSTASISGALTFTGDVTGTGTTGSSTSLTLAASGVTAGTYTKVTVDSKGRVTVGASATTSDISEGTNLYYTDARVLAYLGANNYATQSYVGTQIANLVASAPTTLDTLNELAAALGNDPNFATTIATSIGTKQAQLNGTGFVKVSGTTVSYDNSTYLTTSSAASSYQPLDADLTAIAALGTTGFLKRTGANTWALDTNSYLTSFTETDPIYVASSWYSTTNNASNWNTAYGWGNHASGGYLTTASAASTYASLTGSYANPSWITSLAYSKITGVPAFLTSYTETDPYRVTAVAVSGTSTKTITLTRADSSTVTTTWTDYDTDTNTYVTSAAFSGGTLTLTRNDAGTVAVSLDGRYYLVTNPSGYITSSALSSYLPLSGGTMTGNLINGSGTTSSIPSWMKILTTDVTQSGLGSVYNNKAIYLFNNGSVIKLDAYDYAASAGLSFNIGGNGGTVNLASGATVNTSIILHASNYTSYSPSLTGSGASGTWSINVTGSAGSVAWSNVSGRPTAVSSFTNDAGYITGVTNIAGYSNMLYSNDIRILAPNSLSAYRMAFGFTAWNNNNTSDWADYIHLRSYSDASGGADNLVMFKKNGIGMRIWQQSFGSSSAYSSYVDVLHSNNYSSYAVPTGRTITINGTGYDLSADRSWTISASAAWSSITSGWRESYDLKFRPSNDSGSYAGFSFSKPGSTNEDGGYLLIRGGGDNDVYTQYGITLVADGGWLTLAQRTTASKGVRIMTGTTSAVRISVTDSTTTINNTLNLASLASNDGQIDNNTGGYFHLGGWGVSRTHATAILVNTAYWADNAGTADNSNAIGGVSIGSIVRKDTTGQYLRDYYEYGNYLTSESPSTLVSQMNGSGGLRVDFAGSAYTAHGDWGHIITFSGYNRYSMCQLQSNYYTSDHKLWYRQTNYHNDSWLGWKEFAFKGDSATFSTVSANDVYTTGGWFRNHTNNNGIYWSGTGWHLYPYDNNDFYMRSGATEASIRFLRSDGTVLGYIHNASDYAMGFLTSSRSWRLRVDNSGNTTAYGTMTASVYYDYNDSTYFFDGDGQSRAYRINLSNGQVQAANNAGGRLRISSFTNGESVINGNCHNIVLGPYSTRTGAGLFYAGIAINGLMNYSGSTAYDVAPHIWLGGYYRDTPGSERSDFVVAIKSGIGTSGSGSDLPETRFKVDYEGIATATGSFRAPIFYDSNDTGYYLDPNGYSNLRNLTLTGNWGESPYTSTLTIIGNYPSITLRNPVGDFEYLIHHNGSSQLTFYGGSGYTTNNWSQFAYFSSNGSFYENYDVIAYASDKRLKKNIQSIENAVDKIKKLTGMTYEWNSVGEQYGWKPGTDREAGVFAQDVQEVLPEAVRMAPFDNEDGKSKSGQNFLTVKYEKIVPLLIEAIKEQQKQIEELQNKLDNVLSSR